MPSSKRRERRIPTDDQLADVLPTSRDLTVRRSQVRILPGALTFALQIGQFGARQLFDRDRRSPEKVAKVVLPSVAEFRPLVPKGR